MAKVPRSKLHAVVPPRPTNNPPVYPDPRCPR